MKLKEYIESLKKNPKSIICFTGKSFNYILKNFREELKIENTLSILERTLKKIKIQKKEISCEISTIFSELSDLIRDKGKIFTRMKPNDKVELIKFLKETDSSIVAMCGDGANDSGALIHADVGISISHIKNYKHAAHFYSNEDSISCLEYIIKNGKACYENNVILYKFIFMYSIIQNTSKMILLYYNQSDFSNNQYFYQDFFISFISILTASKYSCR